MVAIFLFCWKSITFNTSYSIKADRFGQFGDFIGGVVGSTWALASVILFYVALKEQRIAGKENQETLNSQINALKQQIEEFKAQRKELELTRNVYEEQTRTLKIQQFESSFYSLLNVYATIKKDLDILDKERDYFRNKYLELDNLHTYSYGCDLIQHHESMVSAYNQLFSRCSNQLSHYFKSFYRIIKTIDCSENINDKEKFQYAKIFRSQLTEYEQLILSYNSHSIYGTKSRALILKYNLLKHTPIFTKPELLHFYQRQKDSKILFFADRLNLFLIEHIPKYYDIDNDVTRIEEGFEFFNCIVGIYFNDEIEIKIICSKNILNDGINLKEDEFSDFLHCFLYEKLLYSTYLKSDQVTLSKFKTETTDKKIFGVTILTQAKLEPNYDRY